MTKKSRALDVSAIEDQVKDLINSANIPDIDKIIANKGLQNKIAEADTDELESIEQELGVNITDTFDETESRENYEKTEGEEDIEIEGLESKEESAHPDDQTAREDIESVDGKFDISIAEDKMSASIDLIPSKGNGKPLRYEVVKASLESMQIVYGVNYDLIKRIITSVEKSKEEKTGVIIAQGTVPEEGKDGSIEYHFSESDEVLRSTNENDPE